MPTVVQKAWLQTMVVPAQLSAAKWGIPASVTLAQAILESAWGTSQLARRCNNYFGIKALAGQEYGEFTTREVVSGRSVMEMAHFAKYPSAIESFAAHGKLMAALPRYADAMAMAAKRLLYPYCVQMQAGGYSTDPHYAERLMALVYQLNLSQYDTPPASPLQTAEEIA